MILFKSTWAIRETFCLILGDALQHQTGDTTAGSAADAVYIAVDAS